MRSKSPKNDAQAPLSRIPWAPAKPATSPASIPSARQQHIRRSGQEAEARALAFLQQQGLVPIARNYRCKCGELDLLMADGDTAVVVEVRKRRSTSHGHPLETIDPFKRQRISLCAQLWWIRQGQRQYKHLRFDVVSILNEAQPQWIRNAWLLTLCKP
ncbi:MAG TPA: YraN family protein [Limnobacter sp.]|uniref:YraN family protein n=1 Tax=Limnobacter sp. TaxID=2003368 RepID=UPI002ED91E18